MGNPSLFFSLLWKVYKAFPSHVSVYYVHVCQKGQVPVFFISLNGLLSIIVVDGDSCERCFAQKSNMRRRGVFKANF